MPLTMFDYAAPSLLRGLQVLETYLDQVGVAVNTGRFSESELLQARLCPDMLSFGQQIQMACDNAKNGLARLAGRKAPRFPDDERALGDFRVRVKKTQAYLQTFSPGDFKDSEGRIVDQPFGRSDYSMLGADYLRAILLPNFYFHVATAHGILRSRGIRVGKSDFLGILPGAVALLAPTPGDGRTIRFLTYAESAVWVAGRGFPEDPADSPPGTGYFQFALQPSSISFPELVCTMMEDFGKFTGGLLLVKDWVWEDEHELDPTQPYRAARGEPRTLSEVPGFVFDEESVGEAADLLALLVERRWTGLFYFGSGVATLKVIEGDRVDVFTSDPQLEGRLRFRLIESGVDFTQ